MSVAIVGGGYTGCLVALDLLKKGWKVTLYEQGPELGGVLRDIVHDGEAFFNGCQYLRLGSLAGKNLLANCYSFGHHYGSYTSLGSNSPRLVDDVAQPTFDGDCSVQPAFPLGGSVTNRLKNFGRHYDDLARWAGSWGDLDELDWQCSVPMQISRVYFPEDLNVASLRMEDPRVEALTVIPRRIRLPNAPIESAFLPKDGYNAFFQFVRESLLDSGCELRLNRPVKVVEDGFDFALSSRGQVFRHDFTVWVSNPVQPLRKICGLRLSTPPTRMRVLYGELRGGSFDNYPIPYYWQIFSSISPIVRIYIYRIRGHLCFTAEAFDTPDQSLMTKSLKDIGSKVGIGGNFDIRGNVLQTRYVNYTQRDRRAVEGATETLLARRILLGAWLTYGREEKIREVSSTISDFIIQSRLEEKCEEPV